MLDEVHLQLGAEELRHRLLDEAVRDGLLGLVLIGGLGREAVRHQHEAVRHVLKADLALVFLILADLLDVAVHGAYEGALCGLLRRAAVLEEGAVVVILDGVDLVREAERRRELDLVLRLVRAVTALALGLDEAGRGERLLPRYLRHVVEDAVLVEEVRRLKLARGYLVSEPEGDARVDHGLALERGGVVLERDVYVREYLEVRPPADVRTGLFAVYRLLGHLALYAALFKVERVFLAVAPDDDVHVLGRVLRRAGAEAVEAQRILVVAALVVAVFAAGIELTEHELPVVFLLGRVPVHGAAAAEVLALDTLVEIARQCYNAAIARAGLVDGVRQDLEHRVLAALEPVRAEYHRRPFPDPVLALELGYALVAVGLGSVSCHLQFFPH